MLDYRVDAHLLVKVGDFGFSRDIYNIDYYRLERRTKLPVKWLPPESLFDNKYSEKSDVVCTTHTKFKLAISTTLIHATFCMEISFQCSGHLVLHAGRFLAWEEHHMLD